VRIASVACGTCLLALVASGCKVESPSSNKVENFSGTIATGGSATHYFNISKDGEFSIILTAVNPAATVGVGYGQPASDGSCVLYGTNLVTIGRQAFASYAVAGPYCVIVYDAGYFIQSETYTIQVSHT
jgi:hypothetical protein